MVHIYHQEIISPAFSWTVYSEGLVHNYHFSLLFTALLPSIYSSLDILSSSLLTYSGVPLQVTSQIKMSSRFLMFHSILCVWVYSWVNFGVIFHFPFSFSMQLFWCLSVVLCCFWISFLEAICYFSHFGYVEKNHCEMFECGHFVRGACVNTFASALNPFLHLVYPILVLLSLFITVNFFAFILLLYLLYYLFRNFHLSIW